MTFKELFRTIEFDNWAFREDLSHAEQFVLNQLDAEKSTLEAGMGGGRLLLYLKKRGFAELSGFDLVPELVDVARRRDADRTMKLSVQDAVRLGYRDETFNQVIYLQQLLSLVLDENSRQQAIKEAFRVLKPGGTALFCVLCFEARVGRGLPRVFTRYLRLLRLFQGSYQTLQYQPWLRLASRFHWSALLDKGPHAYWYRIEEAVQDFERARFRIRAVATDAEIDRNIMVSDYRKLAAQNAGGAFYCICDKP